MTQSVELLTIEEIKSEGFEEIVYIKKKAKRNKNNNNPKKNISNDDKTSQTIVNADDVAQNKEKTKDNDKDKFEPPIRIPNAAEERKLLGKVIEIMIIAGMTNHVYRFNNTIRIQIDGGPIGLSLTGQVADCYMIDWDLKFLKKLEEYKMTPSLYSRFKDDILIATQRLENGTRIVEGKIIIDEVKKKKDEVKSGSNVTFEVLKDIAEEIDPMLKFTIDTPCNYKDGKLPVLDVKVNINVKENYRMDYEFYEKPTKHPKVILANSALSMAQKRTILTQECLRVMRNTKIELGEHVRNQHLSRFMIKLKNSGYSKKFRIEVLDSAIKAFEKMIQDDKKGNNHYLGIKIGILKPDRIKTKHKTKLVQR